MKEKISFLLGVILFFGVFYYAGGAELLDILSKINLIYFSIALVIQISFILFYTLRLRIILSSQKYNLKFRDMFKILVAGMGINQLTPIAKAGGEPVKMYYISKHNIPITKALASVVIEISSDLISIYTTLLFLVILLSSIKYLTLEFLYVSVSIVIFFMISFILVIRFILSEEKIEKFTEKYILKFFKVNVRNSSKVFSRSLKTLFTNKTLEFKIFLISLITRLLEILRIYFLFKAINYPAIIFLVLIVLILQCLFSMIPWLPGGLGLIEGGTISILLLFGLSTSIASSLILLDRFLSFWIPLILGFFSIYFLKKEFSNKSI
ncbi:MAG TPA: flippase-like domain-containing protein [Candidatus Aenigmarchaeota archaeon]|nr:flippase-like domain-containing protein [Candidatus Aenigmarchaeota archaeon]